MGLRSLQVTDFRCLQQLRLELDTDFTFLWGSNASGKTSLLEAIYLLGRGRSFRTRQISHLTRRGAARFVVFGEVARKHGLVSLGVEGRDGALRARIEGRNARSLAELALELPVQIIDPEVHKLIEEGPGRRRRFLDWGVFHVEHSFASHWTLYQQALKQRNAALKAGQPRSVVSIWDPELSRHGEALTQARVQYLERLQPHAATLARQLLDREIELRFRSGWLKEISLSEALERSWPADQERGATHAGPHRAELQVLVDRVLARDHISRGQQKLLAASLLLAQLRLFGQESDGRPVLLLDDPAAELDRRSLGALIEAVDRPAVQLVVTSLSQAIDGLGQPGVRWCIRDGSVQPD